MLAGPVVDFSKLDAEYKRIYDERTALTREGKSLKGQLDGCKKHDDAPAEEVSITDLAGNHLVSPYQWSFTTAAGTGVGSWLPTSTSGAPSARYGHVAVWTGSEMIVAGGMAWDPVLSQHVYSSQYGRYNPTTETWTVNTGAPAAWYQTAVWTGARMLVWGGPVRVAS